MVTPVHAPNYPVKNKALDNHIKKLPSALPLFHVLTLLLPDHQVPANLAKDKALATSPEVALRSAMLATNTQLHKASIDDSLSGTTACVALVKGATGGPDWPAVPAGDACCGARCLQTPDTRVLPELHI